MDDDMDDILNDLLADDTPRKPPAKSSRGRAGPGNGRSPAARARSPSPAKDSMSDVSDADPNQMARSLDGLDDMDAALFGPKKSGGGSGYTPSAASSSKPGSGYSPSAASSKRQTSPTKTPPPKNKYQSPKIMSPERPSTSHTIRLSAKENGFFLLRNKSPSKPEKDVTASPVKTSATKASTLDVDDYDDPLADVLGESHKKPQSRAARRLGEDQTSPNRPHTGPGSGSDSSESRRLEIDRPPTRSGNKTPVKPEASMFDDEDPLDDLGFDDSPRPRSANVTHKASSEDGGKGRSIMDDLLGTNTPSPLTKTPTPGSAGKREFVLDKKYLKQEPKGKEVSEEDFTFGGYMPSAAATPGSRPSSKRSVRFEGDDGDKPMSRGSSAPAGRSRNPASVLEEMMAQDDRDWLDMATGTPPKARDTDDMMRPKSEGSVRKKDTDNSEAVDWLGLSRLGSPTSGHRPSDDSDDFMQPPPRPRSSGRGGIPRDLPEDDWLGTSTNKPTSPQKTPQKTDPKPKPEPAADDWLGTSTGKDTDWLGLKGSPGAKESPRDDWLGSRKESSAVKDSETDDWLGLKPGQQSPSMDGKSDDWLGLSSRKDTKTDGSASGDYMGLGVELDDPFKKPSGSKARADERALDLFSPPPSKDPSSSLPWESESPAGKRRGRSRTPQKAAKPASPRSASPRGPSPSDSPRDLMATLEALKKMEQKTPSGPVKASPGTPPGTGPTYTDPIATIHDSPIPSTALPGTSYPSTAIGPMAQFSPLMPSTSGLEELQRQEELLRKQQETMRELQQKQQVESQRRMVEQQKQAQEQMQRVMQQQQRMMKQQMEQQMVQMSQQPITPIMPIMPNMGMGGAMFGDDMFGQTKRLEMEKLHLMNLLESTKSQHQEEIKLVEESHKKRLELVEDSWSRREQRLKEENDFLISQHQSKLQLMEHELHDQQQAYLRRQEGWEEERRTEMDRLREQHRNDMNSVRQQHEESVERVRRAKELEIEAVASQHSTSRSLHDVIDRISENARGLNELQSQVQLKHHLSLDQREIAAKAREDQVKALQERLERQHHENEQERARLQGLLSKMEVQLTEQSRSMEEEKWRVRQEETRYMVAQEALEKEKSTVMDQFKRERENIQRAKDQLLEEQKSVLAQLYEERRTLAQERAAFEMNNKINSEQMQRESLKNVKTGAELEGSVRILNDEKTRLAQQLDDLRSERESLSRERSDMDTQRHALTVEREKLEAMAGRARQTAKDMDARSLMADKVRQEGDTALMEARRLEGEQGQRLNSIQAQLNTLRTKEKQIAQERLNLAKEKQTIEENAKSMLCINCRTPVRDVIGGPVDHMTTSATPGQAIQLGGRKMTAAASNLLSSLDPDLRAKVQNMDSISAQIELDRSIRLWRIAASKDQDFLAEESMFLQAIRHSPYGDSSSKS